MEPMNAQVTIAGYMPPISGLSYWCPNCGQMLWSEDDNILFHPDKVPISLTQNQPIKCKYAGLKFKRPVNTVKLEFA